MQDSIFTKIIKGEIPCNKVYEDDKNMAFLDLHPKQPGHVLVVPKKQVDHIWDLPEDDYLSLMEAVKKVGQRVREVLRPKRVGIQVEGLGVPHAHVHVFPFSSTPEFFSNPDLTAEPDYEALAAMAKKLAF
jgi:histidine triad (HIT) family protein